MTMLNIGLIGAGRIGRVHAATLTTRVPNAKLMAVADVVEEAASSLAQEYAIPDVYPSHEPILADPAIDAIVVASATDTHTAIIKDAAEAGKHVFTEKPLALDLAEIDEAIAATERAGVKLQVGFNRRFDASFARVKAAITAGEIGEPQMLHITSRDPAPPPVSYVRVSGGIFLDMMIHDFDMARFLMGSEVSEVFARGAVLIDPAIGEAGDVDTAVVTLQFENGALGVIDNSRQAVYGYDQRVDVLGSAGGARVENNFPNNATISTAKYVRRDLPLHFFLERYAESYAAELGDFVGAVLNNSPVPVSGHDGKMPVVMGLAAGRSLHENRPVPLSEILGA